MKISVLSLFGNFFNEFLKTSIIKNAINNKIVTIEIIDFRKFSKDKHQKVDDKPYGGGAGMILSLQPIVDTINFYKKAYSKVILLSPSGKTYNQLLAQKLKDEKHLILVCGHYEGFDERITNYIDDEISVGDYILTGGEIPAMIVIDSVVRLLPNAISENSLQFESFKNNLLDYPNYTRPYNFNGYKVPDVLLSGNHEKIKIYRSESQIQKTKTKRIDLFNQYKKEIKE